MESAQQVAQDRNGQETGMDGQGDLMNAAALAMYLIPKNLVSFVTGVLVRLKLPRPIARWLCVMFVRAFKVDMSDADQPTESYPTLEALFTRRLQPGARAVTGPVCSPADGRLARSEACSDGTAIQAKGFSYSLGEMVFGGRDDAVAAPMKFGWYQTVYLAPHNYHRVHSPVAGRLTEIRYIPGQLWPVNRPFLSRVPRIFTRNERLVFDFEVELSDAPGRPKGRVAVVMVGALNVGRMTSEYAPNLTTNAAARQLGAPGVCRWPVNRMIAAGDELGVFRLGSTVVTVFDQTMAGVFALTTVSGGREVRMGQSLLAGSDDPARSV